MENLQDRNSKKNKEAITMRKMKKIKLGDRVTANCYIKKSGIYYDIDNECGSRVLCNGIVDNKGEDTALGTRTPKFKTVKTKEFSGIYVGKKKLSTILRLQFVGVKRDYYGNEEEKICLTNDEAENYLNGYYQAKSIEPQEFAIVYYACNRKRLVPINNLELAELLY